MEEIKTLSGYVPVDSVNPAELFLIVGGPGLAFLRALPAGQAALRSGELPLALAVILMTASGIASAVRVQTAGCVIQTDRVRPVRSISAHGCLVLKEDGDIEPVIGFL